jgi:MarR family transcriptional regulator, lower aerobic nicotinate degradation pathway regulator
VDKSSRSRGTAPLREVIATRAPSPAPTELGLKPRQLRLLVLVDRAPGLNQRELARQLEVDAGNLIAILDGLEADGLLLRTRDEADRRQRLVSLIPKGQQVLAAAHAATEAVEAQVFAGVPASRQDDFYCLALAAYRRL